MNVFNETTYFAHTYTPTRDMESFKNDLRYPLEDTQLSVSHLWGARNTQVQHLRLIKKTMTRNNDETKEMYEEE